MSDYVIAESQRVERPPTEDEVEARLAHYAERTQLAETRARLDAWQPVDEADADRKSASEIGYQANLAEIERLANLPVTLHVTVERELTPEEQAQRELDVREWQEHEVRETLERAEREARVDAALDKLGLTREAMREVLQSVGGGQ